MTLGFTFDLRDHYLAQGYSPEAAAEFDKPQTVDAIEQALVKRGHRVDRIGNVRHLVARLAGGGAWDMVFNIAEGVRGFAREAQVPALLEAYGIPVVFSDALTLSLCLHKGYAKRVVRDLGLPTPRFAVVDDPAAAVAADLRYPLFVKPVAEGTGKGVSSRGKVDGAEQLRAVAATLIPRFRQPVLVEEFLPGREFTVGIVGTGETARALGVMEVALRGDAEPYAYSFENKDRYEDRVEYRLADDPEARAAAAIALAAYRGLGCRDAGRVDLRSDAAGSPSFIEINPLAGLDSAHSDLPILCRLLGHSFDDLIGWILDSAEGRA